MTVEVGLLGPLRVTVDGRSVELPADTEAFTGRNAALKTLDRLLDDQGGPEPRPVVIAAITGTAGIGKTALAVHWAHRVADRSPAGTCTSTCADSTRPGRRHAIKGNVEAELASAEDAGCGCAYPDYVEDVVVDRSNQIIARLRATAEQFPDLVDRLGGLPRYLTVRVGAERVGIVHGDPESLAGWGLALEAMEPGDPAVREQTGYDGQPTTRAQLEDWFRRADVSVFASTHTGLPYAQDFLVAGRQRLVINNGAAGLGNFAGTTYGVMTRLSSDLQAPADSLYGITIGGLRCDAVPVRFDLAWWRARFLVQWPPGSPGYRSYFTRITGGSLLRREQAARGNVQGHP